MSLRDKSFHGDGFGASAGDGRIRVRRRDRGDASDWDPEVLLAPVLGRPPRVGAAALVVSLLEFDPRQVPNSVCGNLVFAEALPDRNLVPASFRVCDHLFVSLLRSRISRLTGLSAAALAPTSPILMKEGVAVVRDWLEEVTGRTLESSLKQA